jgi:hypothetical protein
MNRLVLVIVLVLATACGAGTTSSGSTTPIVDPIPMVETAAGSTLGVKPAKPPERTVPEPPVVPAVPVVPTATTDVKPDAPVPSDHKVVKRPAAPVRVQIVVTKAGFEPSNVTVPRGKPVILRFERLVERTCGTEVVMVVDGKTIEKDLPLNKPVEIAVTFRTAGTVKYSCAMDMIRGSITVK